MFNFVKKEVARLEVAQSEFGFVASLFQFFQGRATTFAIVFAICGLILAFRGKLTADYALLVTAIQGWSLPIRSRKITLIGVLRIPQL